MELPKRKPTRMKGFDYSTNAAYFITICTHNRTNILCDIVGAGSARPKPAGIIAEKYIHKMVEKYENIAVDKYVIMPNHIHLLLIIDNNGTADPSPTVSRVIGWYKYVVTKEICQTAGSEDNRIFQRSFHDHIIRGEKDYRKIYEYIESNPSIWIEDCFYKENL